MRSHVRVCPSWIGIGLSLGLAVWTGCGNGPTPASSSSTSSSSSTPAGSSVSITLSPAAATVTEGASISYFATVQGTANAGLSWSVQEGALGGAVTSSGVYTAPNRPGTFHVIATSVADPTAIGSSVVSVLTPAPVTPPGVTITPVTATVAEGGSLYFLGTAEGVSSTAVTYSIQEGATGGSITSTGTYTAPNTVGTYHVVATSAANPTLSASAAVTTYLPNPEAPGTFTAVGNMSMARVGHTATLLRNGKVLIAGGSDGLQSPVSAELYDPATRTFATTGSMITPRGGHSATLLADGRVLMAGGTFANGSGDHVVYTAEIYDPSTGAFTATGDLIPGAPSGATTLLPDGRVFVSAVNTAEIYDPQNGTFTRAPYAVLGTFYGSNVTLLTNGKVLITGCDLLDSRGFCVGMASELFDPQSGTFSATGSLTSPLTNESVYSATLLADGRVLYVGSDDYLNTDVEVYNPATGTFASIGSTTTILEGATATRLDDGTVLLAGGQGGAGDGVRNAELYLPASDTIEPAGGMTVGRYAHTATLLPDGTVLITGGIGAYPESMPSAEIYTPR